MKRPILITLAGALLVAGSTLALSQATTQPAPTERMPSGQTPGATPGGTTQQPGAQPGDRKGTTQQPGTTTQQKQPTPGQQQTTQTPGSPSGSVTLTTEQKTKIRSTVLASGPKVSKVDFQLSVGTVVPRSVKMVAVPATLVEIHPAWRGMMFFVVGDQIIIVDASSLKIIAVVSV